MTQKGAKQLKIVGIISIIFGVITFFLGTGSFENKKSYGGDAYTGIQQAAAQAANNIQSAGGSIKFALAALLIVAGLTLLVVGRNIVTKAEAIAPVGYAAPAATAYATPTATAAPTATAYAAPVATAAPTATAYAQPVAAPAATATTPTYTNTTV